MKLSKEKAIEYLEEIQAECLQSRFGKNYPSQFENLINKTDDRAFLDSYLKSQPSISNEDRDQLLKSYTHEKESVFLYTKYEIPQSYIILKTVFDEVISSAEKLSLATKNIPFIGTAQSKEYNASAIKVEGFDEYLIVFEGELFTLANQLTKIFALSLPDFKMNEQGIFFSYEKDRIKDHIHINLDLQNIFTDFVYNVIYLGQPNLTRHFFMPEHFGRLQFELLNSLELFVVGHEYGHICCEHLSKADILHMQFQNRKLNVISPDWEMEYQADGIGLSILLKSIESGSLIPFSFLGPELFFTFLDLDERVNSLFRMKNEKRIFGSSSHPPNVERRNRINDIILRSINDTPLGEYYSLLSKLVENVFEALWENFKIRHRIENRQVLEKFLVNYTAPIKELLNYLKIENDPFILNITPDNESEELSCFENINRIVQKKGGEIIHGWLLHNVDYMIEAEFHAIWKDPKGNLIDLTPDQSAFITERLFVIDENRQFDGDRVDNFRLNLTKNPLVDDIIELERAKFWFLEKGDRKEIIGRILLNEQDQSIWDELVNLSESVESLYYDGENLDTLCFCDSGLRYNSCHRVRLKELVMGI